MTTYRHRKAARIRACFVFLLTSAGVAGVAAAQQPAVASKYLESAKWDRAKAASIRADANEFFGSIERLGPYVRDDIPMAREAAEACAAAYDRSAAAYERGDQAEAERHRAEGAKLDGPWYLLRNNRLTEARRKQAEAAPEESWYEDQMRWQPKRTLHAIDPLIRAKRNASDAWGRLAEATVPGVDPAKLTELKEQAYLADAEAEIANLEWKFATGLDQYWPSDKITNDEIVARHAALRKLQQERIAAMREEVARDRKKRELEAKTKQAQQELLDAWRAERDAQAKAPKKK